MESSVSTSDPNKLVSVLRWQCCNPAGLTRTHEPERERIKKREKKVLRSFSRHSSLGEWFDLINEAKGKKFRERKIFKIKWTKLLLQFS